MKFLFLNSTKLLVTNCDVFVDHQMDQLRGCFSRTMVTQYLSGR